MWGITRNLNDKQIDGLAAYYEKQATTVSATNTTGPGKTIFENGVPDKGIPACATCHGPEGHGNGQFPRLAGQHADYLVKQLNVFQRTDQRPDGAIMKTVAHDLTPANIDNVTKYIAALK
ncbi:MAG: c-type cytochrome [Burkholderiaceae bacterium]